MALAGRRSAFFGRFLRHRARNLRNVLIIGSDQEAITLADNFLKDSKGGYQVKGFVDDLWRCDGAPQSYRELLIGGFEDIAEILRDLALDEVIITLTLSSHQVIPKTIDLCRKQGITVRAKSGLVDIPGYAASVIASSRMITFHDRPRDKWSIVGKRLVDLIISVIALIVTLPLLACIGLAIKFTSPGPIIFAQERLGIGKRPFRVFKFRTMVVNAESLMGTIEHLNQAKGAHFKLQNDPRVTRIGAFLRKTSLDELPQLFNVLLGNMSLVGPRPIVMRDYRGISEDWHRRRFSVKPGITCLWQVGGRSSVTFDRWMELDIEYIDRWSLWLDFRILIRTIPAVIGRSGAM